jgi:hypothetical protein
MRYTFIDAEDGTQESFESMGEGLDTGDKAVYKALAGAFKYAITQGLCIPTGEQDDPEHHSPERDGRPKVYEAKNAIYTGAEQGNTANTSSGKRWPLSEKQQKWLGDLIRAAEPAGSASRAS